LDDQMKEVAWAVEIKSMLSSMRLNS